MPDLDYHSRQLLEKLQKQLQEALDRQNVAYLGEVKVVRIPQIPGRIRKLSRQGDSDILSVEYISDQWYDKESGQPRNEKHIIGMIFPDYPMALIPNDNYYQYFDEATGKPKVLPGMRNPANEESKKTKTIKTTGPDTQAVKATENRSDSRGRSRLPEGNKEDDKETNEEKDSTYIDDAINEFLKGIEKNRKEAEAAMIRNEEEEERRKRNLELYGDQDYSDIEQQEATDYLMALFDEAEKEEAGTEGTMKKDEQPENTTETSENPAATNPIATKSAATNSKAEKTENASPVNPDNPELQQTYREYKNAKERQAILGKILNEVRASIRNLAKRRPDDIVNEYKANRINRLLKEAISRYENSDYTDLMELIELPREAEQDGEIVQTGMTYSDLELLLDHYCTILHFIPSGK